jgi:hypothetical protein
MTPRAATNPRNRWGLAGAVAAALRLAGLLGFAPYFAGRKTSMRIAVEACRGRTVGLSAQSGVSRVRSSQRLPALRPVQLKSGLIQDGLFGEPQILI